MRIGDLFAFGNISCNHFELGMDMVNISILLLMFSLDRDRSFEWLWLDFVLPFLLDRVREHETPCHISAINQVMG